MLEGPDLVLAALDSGEEFEALYVERIATASDAVAAVIDRARAAGVRVFALEAGVLEKIADTTTPQPVLASVRFRVPAVDSLAVRGLTLVLHDVRDPGNAGTIIRSADAAGVTSVVLSGQSVDPFNPKTLRASAGSIFHLPVAVGPLGTVLDHFVRGGARTWATVVRAGVELTRADLSGSSVVVIGNEADGLDQAAIDLCQGALRITMAGRSESLNAGVAASLVAFVALWQREGTGSPLAPPSLTGL